MQTFEKWGLPVLGNPLSWIIFLIQLKNILMYPPLLELIEIPMPSGWIWIPRAGETQALQLPFWVPSVLVPAQIRNCGMRHFGFLLLLHVHYVGCMLNIANDLFPKKLEVFTKNSAVISCFLMHIDPRKDCHTLPRLLLSTYNFWENYKGKLYRICSEI